MPRPTPQALKAQLEAAEGLAVKECVLGVIGAVGSRLASHNAHLLVLAILVLSLDSQDACLRAAAAEALAGEPSTVACLFACLPSLLAASLQICKPGHGCSFCRALPCTALQAWLSSGRCH